MLSSMLICWTKSRPSEFWKTSPKLTKIWTLVNRIDLLCISHIYLDNMPIYGHFNRVQLRSKSKVYTSASNRLLIAECSLQYHRMWTWHTIVNRWRKITTANLIAVALAFLPTVPVPDRSIRKYISTEACVTFIQKSVSVDGFPAVTPAQIDRHVFWT